MIAEAALPEGCLLPQTSSEKASETAGETTPGDEKEVRWEVVAVTNGLTEAAIIRGRLESEGIPARVHQEPAGVAIGLTLGLLGQAKVLVPEPLAEQALEILSQSNQQWEEDERDE
jgi:hypothetical protein